MRLGRRAAYLRRCIEVIELLTRHENATTVRCRVFEQHIRPVIRCSYTTFNNMLNEPNPQRQLDEIMTQISNLN